MKKSVLVTGVIRSGTTWVGHVLDTALDTIYIHEPFNPDSNWNACFPTPTHYLHLTSENGGIYIYLWKQLLKLRPIIRGVWRDAVRQNIEAYIERHVKRATDKSSIVPIVKDPIALYSVEWLVETFGMSPVFVLRHPISIVKSIVNLEWWGIGNGNALFNQPLLRRRFFPHISDDDRHQHSLITDPVERICWAVRLHYEAVSLFRREYPEWLYVSYEDLTLNPEARFLDLMAALELTPSEYTLAHIGREGAIAELRGLSRREALVPVPSKVDQIFAPTARVAQWHEKFDTYFADLAEDFRGIWPQTVESTD